MECNCTLLLHILCLLLSLAIPCYEPSGRLIKRCLPFGPRRVGRVRQTHRSRARRKRACPRYRPSSGHRARMGGRCHHRSHRRSHRYHRCDRPWRPRRVGRVHQSHRSRARKKGACRARRPGGDRRAGRQWLSCGIGSGTHLRRLVRHCEVICCVVVEVVVVLTSCLEETA